MINLLGKAKLLLFSLAFITIFSLGTAKVSASINITEYSTPTSTTDPGPISIGMNGEMWFVKTREKQVVKLTSDGKMTEYPLAPSLQDGRYFNPNAIINLGPDGNMWFTSEEAHDNNENDEIKDYINKITPLGQVTSYEFSTDTLPVTPQNINRNKTPGAVTAGADGNLWITAGRIEDDQDARYSLITKMDTSGHILSFYEQTDDARASSTIVSAKDGSLWFLPGNAVKRITTNGEVTRYALRDGLKIMQASVPTESSNGSIWFYAFERDENDPNMIKSYIVEVSLSGVITEHNLEDNAFLFTIANTPDDNLWFVNQKISPAGELQQPTSLQLGRLDPSTGSITYSNTPSTEMVFYITTGPDGNLWGITVTGKVVKIVLSDENITTIIKPPKTGNTAIIVLTTSSFLALIGSVIFAHKHVTRRT